MIKAKTVTKFTIGVWQKSHGRTEEIFDPIPDDKGEQFLKRMELRLTHSCVAAAAMLVAQASLPAEASQKHTLKPGETLSAVARKYGLTPQDIITANRIADPLNVRDGKVLVIPDAPKPVKIANTMKQARIIGGDRVKVRIAPGGESRLIDMFDKGVPVVMTAHKEGWAQITLPNGKSGWVREDLLGSPKPLKAAVQTATKLPKPVEHKAPKPVAIAHRAEETREKVRKAARGRQMETTRRTAQKHRKREVEFARHHRKGWSKRGRQYVSGYRSYGGRNIPEAAIGGKPNNDVIREALSYRGTPYRSGGGARGGFDCSGFTSYLYNKRGKGLPHSAAGQFHAGAKVSPSQMKPGDLVFFETVRKGISHVGVYAGNGKFVHSSSRRAGGVRVDSLSSGYYSQTFRGARRVR